MTAVAIIVFAFAGTFAFRSIAADLARAYQFLTHPCGTNEADSSAGQGGAGDDQWN